jgi:hypothetical protein
MLESMIPSLSYIPIVGFVQTDSKNKLDFAGHEERISVTVNGVEVEYLGRMYGFLPSECNPRFETKNVNGVDREYLVADGLIVNKFAKAKEIFDRDAEKAQSMELERESLDGYYDKDNDQFMITSARFEALCVLGDSKIPAMIGGAIEKIQFTAIKFELKELIDELKLEYEKGGAMLDVTKLMELVSNYSYVSDSFIDELKEKLSEYETEEQLVEVLKDENDKQFALIEKENLATNETEGEEDIPKEEEEVVETEAKDEADAKYEEIKAEYEAKLESQKAEFESKFSVQETELVSLRQYKSVAEAQIKTDYINSVENLESYEKEDLIKEIDKYSIDELVDEVAKFVGKKAIKFSVGEKVVDDFTNRQPKETVKRRSYEVLFNEKN